MTVTAATAEQTAQRQGLQSHVEDIEVSRGEMMTRHGEVVPLSRMQVSVKADGAVNLAVVPGVLLTAKQSQTLRSLAAAAWGA